jgi:hypothetical protein
MEKDAHAIGLTRHTRVIEARHPSAVIGTTDLSPRNHGSILAKAKRRLDSTNLHSHRQPYMPPAPLPQTAISPQTSPAPSNRQKPQTTRPPQRPSQPRLSRDLCKSGGETSAEAPQSRPPGLLCALEVYAMIVRTGLIFRPCVCAPVATAGIVALIAPSIFFLCDLR